MVYGLKRKGLLGRKRNYIWKVGQLTLLVITFLGFNLIVIRHTLVWYLQNYCWMFWSLFIAVKTTPDFCSVQCLYSCDTQQVPFRYQTGKKVNKIQAWSLHSVKPSAMGFHRIGLTLRLASTGPYSSKAHSLRIYPTLQNQNFISPHQQFETYFWPTLTNAKTNG